MDEKSLSSDENSKNSKSIADLSNNQSENSSNLNDDKEHLINYFQYINESKTKIEEQRQIFFNKLSELKSQVDNIKSKSNYKLSCYFSKKYKWRY